MDINGYYNQIACNNSLISIKYSEIDRLEQEIIELTDAKASLESLGNLFETAIDNANSRLSKTSGISRANSKLAALLESGISESLNGFSPDTSTADGAETIQAEIARIQGQIDTLNGEIQGLYAANENCRYNISSLQAAAAAAASGGNSK